MELAKDNNQIFTGEQIKNFADFSNYIKIVHNRLISEGYTIKDNEIIPPKKLETKKEI